MLVRLAATFLLSIPLFAAVAPKAVAEPGRIIILRHGEKQNAYQLCDVGVQRSLALTTRYLGRGAENQIYGPRGMPDAFFAITLHTLELIAPSATSWRMPVIMNTVLPRPKQEEAEFTHRLNLRTQEAATEVMKNWNGKTVVMAWEHRHIADEKLVLAFPRLKVTLRQLFNLDNIASVPKTWPGDNYDYFWIIDYDAGRLTNFQMLKQTFPAPFQNVPSNDWDTPAALPKDCEGSKD